MELYRSRGFPPVHVDIDFMDTEHGASGEEEGYVEASWTHSAPSFMGLNRVAASNALRPGASRFTCNGEVLRSSPSHQAPVAMPHPIFVTCNYLPMASASAAPSCANQRTATAAEILFLQSGGRISESPFAQVSLQQFPTNVCQAAKTDQTAEFADGLLLEQDGTRAALSNSHDEGDGLTERDLVPASPARVVPDGAVRVSAAVLSKAELDEEAPLSLAGPVLLTAMGNMPVLPERVHLDMTGAGAYAVCCGDGECGVAAPASEVEGNSAHSRAVPCGASSSDVRGAARAARARRGRAALPATSSQSSLGFAGDSDGDDSEVVKRSTSVADLDVSSAACASGTAAQPQASVQEAKEAIAVAVVAPKPEERRGQKRRAAAVGAAWAIRAARERVDDDDEDYDEREALGAGVGARSQKRVKKAIGSRQKAGKAAKGDVVCYNCSATETPQWRCGPDGPRTLCNACGVKFKKGQPLQYVEKKRQTGK